MFKKKKFGLRSKTESKIRKKYPTSGLASVIAVTPEDSLRLPSRILPLNYQLNGGPRYGTMVELYGEESTGKSLLSMEFAYAAQKLGGQVIWVDAENSFERTWFEQNGIDITKLELLTQENAIEVISDYIMDMVVMYRSRLTKNEPILIVLDSTAALETLDNIDGEQTNGKAEMGNRAKEIYKFFRRRSRLLARYGIIFIMINQLRKKVGASQWEDPDTTPGGQAAKFYAHQRISLIRGKQVKKKIKGEEIKIGQNVFIKTKKDKTGPPRSQTDTQVYFIKTKTNQVGFNRYLGLSKVLTNLGIVERNRGKFFKDEIKIATSDEDFEQKLLEDTEFRKSLLTTAPINTISKTQQQLDKITSNLYPVKLKGEEDEDK